MVLQKAYTEGTYADTPGNRKLNRVGQSYSEEKGSILFKSNLEKDEKNIINESENKYEICSIFDKKGNRILHKKGRKI